VKTSFSRRFFFSLLPLVFAAAGILSAAPAPPARVVSQTVFTDELLLALAEPGQVASLSHLSRDPRFSAVSKEAAAHPALPFNADAEAILRHRPNLVLFADYSRAELVAQIRRAGVPVMVFDRYNTLDDAFHSLNQLAARLGAPAEKRAAAVIDTSRRRVAALRERLRGVKPVRVISPSTYDVLPGDRTNFQDFCDHAGAENLAKTLGGLTGNVPAPGERVLAWPVDKVVLVADAFTGVPTAAQIESATRPFLRMTPYRYMRAVRERRVALLGSWHSSCVSHHRIDAYESLARQLHPEAFAKTKGAVAK
jgi:iron complex transport system substrate-binding protein